MRSLVRIAILAAALASASACSGGHRDAEHRSAKQNAAFIAHAEHICAHARTELDALPAFPFRHFDALHPDPRLLPKVGRFFTGPGNELPIVRRLDERLHALGTPPANYTEWSNVVETIDGYVAVFKREDTAALRADSSSWVHAVRLNRRLHKRLADAILTFAVNGCDVL